MTRYVRPYIDRRINAAFEERGERELMAQAPILRSQSASFAAAQRLLKREHDALQARVDELTRRLDTRPEVALEASGATGDRGTAQGAPARVIPARLEVAGEDIRLTLSGGQTPPERLVNADGTASDGLDVEADVRSLPLQTNSVATIRSSHLLERFTLDELKHTILPHWYSLLRPGGCLITVASDTEAMIGEYIAGRMSFEDLRRRTFGDDHAGGSHRNMFSPQSLRALVEEVGFVDVSVVGAGRPGDIGYELEIRAAKPGSRASMERAASPGASEPADT